MTDWNDLYEKFKNKQLGKDQMEIIKKGIADDYNSNPDLQKLVLGVGDFYQDLRTVEGEEKYNPLNYLTAGTLRAMEGAGWLADQTAGRFLKNTIHNTLRVDPSVAEVGSQGVQMFAAPKAISKGIGLVNKAIASPQAHNLAYKAGQSARRFKDRLGSVPTTAYDDAIGIFELSSKEFNELSKLSKQPGINSLTLARRFQLQKQALNKKYGNFKSDPKAQLIEDPTPPKKRKERRIGIDVSTNEKLKQSLLKNEQIELPPAYLGGPKEFRDKADFFDVSAAIMGGGKEDMIDPATGKYFTYDRLASTEFGKTAKSKNRAIIFNHIKENIGAENITLEEFNKYAAEQVAAETDLRNAIRLLNLKSYAANRYVDLSPYKTKEEQLAFLGEINRAKRPPRRRKDKNTGEYTEDIESFEARYEIWKLDTAPFQQYTDYKETFDYGHIIGAKNVHRQEDMGANRISNTEIEAAHNIVSRDPATQKYIEILQEGNRERGARRDYLPSIQMMRNTSATVIEDFVKWKASQPGAEGPDLTALLDKFMPRDQHENYLKFVKKRFEERRSMSGSLRQFMEYELGIPYEDYLKFPNRLKLKVRALYNKDKKASGDVIGMQQYMQGREWMREAADEFIGLHHFNKNKRLRTTKEDIQLKDIPEEQYEEFVKNIKPKTYEDLLNMILNLDD